MRRFRNARGVPSEEKECRGELGTERMQNLLKLGPELNRIARFVHRKVTMWRIPSKISLSPDLFARFGTGLDDLGSALEPKMSGFGPRRSLQRSRGGPKRGHPRPRSMRPAPELAPEIFPETEVLHFLKEFIHFRGSLGTPRGRPLDGWGPPAPAR